MNRYLSIACLQYTSTKDELHTLKTIKLLIDKAVKEKAELIALPECATSLHKSSIFTKKLAKPENKNVSLQYLRETARSKSIFILIGSLPIKLNDKLVNRSFLVGPDGDILYKYDKIHLYDVNLPGGEIYRESDTYLSGNKAIIAKITKMASPRDFLFAGFFFCYLLGVLNKKETKSKIHQSTINIYISLHSVHVHVQSSLPRRREATCICHIVCGKSKSCLSFRVAKSR